MDISKIKEVLEKSGDSNSIAVANGHALLLLIEEMKKFNRSTTLRSRPPEHGDLIHILCPKCTEERPHIFAGRNGEDTWVCRTCGDSVKR